MSRLNSLAPGFTAFHYDPRWTRRSGLIVISLETALKYCNYVFTSTFVIEATLKLVAFGFRRFFKD
ncbi:hypothetical protein CRUP_025396, partial [Coryphaenoides rupestris]